LSKEASAKSPSPSLDRANAAPIIKIFVFCDQKESAPVLGCILHQEELSVILETSVGNSQKAGDCSA
jgi:hypothetical protein